MSKHEPHKETQFISPDFSQPSQNQSQKQLIQGLQDRLYLSSRTRLAHLLHERISEYTQTTLAEYVRKNSFSPLLELRIRGVQEEIEQEILNGENPGIGLHDIKIPRQIYQPIFQALTQLPIHHPKFHEDLDIQSKSFHRYCIGESKSISPELYFKAVRKLADLSDSSVKELITDPLLYMIYSRPEMPIGSDKIPISRNTPRFTEIKALLNSHLEEKLDILSKKYISMFIKHDGDEIKCTDLLIEIYGVLPDKVKSEYQLEDVQAMMNLYASAQLEELSQ